MAAFLVTALGFCNKKKEDSSSMKMGSDSATAKVFIISPQDGAEVTSPVTVKFGIEGMKIAPADSDEPNTGHHHLLIDVEQMPDLNLPVPMDEHHKHFGKGQTETTLELSPGKHTLQLLLADRAHIPQNPPVISKKITITVK